MGIRARPGLDDRSIADLRLLAARGKSLDLLAPPALAAEIARRVPELTIVLDHLAGAKVAEGAPAKAWLDDLRAAAAFPNVYCKLSGLDQQAGRAGELELFRPTLDALWAAFGEDRLMYGSNWRSRSCARITGRTCAGCSATCVPKARPPWTRSSGATP